MMSQSQSCTTDWFQTGLFVLLLHRAFIVQVYFCTFTVGSLIFIYLELKTNAKGEPKAPEQTGMADQ